MSFGGRDINIKIENDDSNDETISMFKILIASDIHLGYNEKHPIRGQDSFRTFEEILQAAQNEDVDFILLAGDLFHINRPTVSTLRQAMKLIRQYCFGGDGQKRFQVKNFKQANCLDPNIKVKHPIFTIHGNHDDPIGLERDCSLDLLATSGLINYFGKQKHVEKLILKPIIFEKGHTKIMLFGFGSMREERLNHLIQTDNFHYMAPSESPEVLKNFFKILLLHQNKIPRPGIKHVNPYDLDDLPDLVIWGHEHKPVPELEHFEQNKFFILQPGSTVATSLCDAEQGDKYYYLLNCYYDSQRNKPRFKIIPKKCQTIRPFIQCTLDTEMIFNEKIKSNDGFGFKSSTQQQQYLYQYCRQYLETLLNDATNMLNGRLDEYDEDFKKPLIRIRIFYQDKDQLFDRKKFEIESKKKVANPDEILRFTRKRKCSGTDDHHDADDDDDYKYEIEQAFQTIDYRLILQKIGLRNILDDYLASSEQRKMSLFDETFFNDKFVDFVEKKPEIETFKDFFSNTKQLFTTILMMNMDNTDISTTTTTNNQNLEQHFKELCKDLKKKIELNDDTERKKLLWITLEPEMKRTQQLIKNKVPLNLIPPVINTTNNLNTDETIIINNNNNNSKKKNNPKEDDDFYKDDIDLFEDINDDSDDGDDQTKQPKKRNTRSKVNNKAKKESAKTKIGGKKKKLDDSDIDNNHDEDDDCYGQPSASKRRTIRKSYLDYYD